MPRISISSVWSSGEELEEVRRGHFLRSPQPESWHRCDIGGTEERILRLPVQEQLHPNSEEAEGVLLVQRAP